MKLACLTQVNTNNDAVLPASFNREHSWTQLYNVLGSLDDHLRQNNVFEVSEVEDFYHPAIHRMYTDHASLILEVAYYQPTHRPEIRAALTLLHDEGFIKLKASDAKVVDKARQATRTQMSQSHWKQCLQIVEWQGVCKYAWPFLRWDFPSHVASITDYIDWTPSSLIGDWQVAKYVRVKNHVLNALDWSWLPVSPYVTQIKDELLKMAAACIFKSDTM